MLGRYGPNQLVPPELDPAEPAPPGEPGLPGLTHESLTSTPLLLMTPVAADALWGVSDSWKSAAMRAANVAILKKAK
jgi:hypothetical protein